MSTSWTNGEQGILSEGDEKADSGNEDKEFRLVEAEKNG
jgi:hypothetical protein